MNKERVTLNSSDVYGTPYSMELDSGEVLQLHPPTLKYFESLYASYNITLDEAISNDSSASEELGYIRAMSRVMQMLHIARVMVDSTVTFEDIEALVQEDPTVLTKYLQTFVVHLPTNKVSNSQVQPKKSRTPNKIWMPK